MRKDVNRAVVIATFGIALLLVFSFHRPLVGLLAFLPALAGTAVAFMLCALLFPTLSIMALGFGGAIISITVDHGIAYLLFLDQPWRVTGKEASEKLRSVGLLAALTTMGAFGLLCFSAFPVFRQLGLFTALGIGFSFVFVHTMFPRLFPIMPPAEPRSLPFRKIAPWLSSGGKKGAWFALALGISMLFFARPEFNVELSAMNTVSKETKAAETRVTQVWGDRVFKQVFLMTEGESPQKMRLLWDRLMKRLETDKKAGIIASAFVPSMIFPGDEVRKENYAAWRSFWKPERIRSFREALAVSAAGAGFKPDAFEPFFKMLAAGYADLENREMPEEFFELSSIRKKDDGTGWSQFSILGPGPAYDPETFYETYRVFGPVFDADLFSKRLGRLLFDNFTTMLVVIGAGVALLLFVFFLDWKLTALALLPVLFAMSCALGSMKLIGHPLDIPGLMLSIVVFGMGIDYSLYIVRAFQRTEAADHPDTLLIETGVFMAAASTMIGFGVLVFSEHSLLKSAGLTSLLGIAFAFAGTFAILPPVLSAFYRRRKPSGEKKRVHRTKGRPTVQETGNLSSPVRPVQDQARSDVFGVARNRQGPGESGPGPGRGMRSRRTRRLAAGVFSRSHGLRVRSGPGTGAGGNAGFGGKGANPMRARTRNTRTAGTHGRHIHTRHHSFPDRFGTGTNIGRTRPSDASPWKACGSGGDSPRPMENIPGLGISKP